MDPCTVTAERTWELTASGEIGTHNPCLLQSQINRENGLDGVNWLFRVEEASETWTACARCAVRRALQSALCALDLLRPLGQRSTTPCRLGLPAVGVLSMEEAGARCTTSGWDEPQDPTPCDYTGSSFEVTKQSRSDRSVRSLGVG